MASRWDANHQSYFGLTPKLKQIKTTLPNCFKKRDTCHKVASGAAESISFIQVTNLARTIRALKKRNIWIFGLDEKAETSFYDADLTGPIALVLGGEGQGLRHLTEQYCDVLYFIPMIGIVSSLNLAVAAGVSLFEAVRQRSFDLF